MLKRKWKHRAEELQPVEGMILGGNEQKVLQ